jgi:hypothetical protein
MKLPKNFGGCIKLLNISKIAAVLAVFVSAGMAPGPVRAFDPPTIPDEWNPAGVSPFVIEQSSSPWNLRIFPMIHSAGVHVAETGSGQIASGGIQLIYKETSQDWSQALPAHKFTGRIDHQYDLYTTSLFYLSPNTDYDIRITGLRNSSGQDIILTDSFRTRRDEQVFSPERTYYVDRQDAQASDSNPGTASEPWRTIGEAVDRINSGSIGPGSRVIVRAGVYTESLTINRSGLPDRWIQIIGEPGAVLSGHDPNLDNLGSSGWNSYRYTSSDITVGRRDYYGVINGNNMYTKYPGREVWAMWWKPRGSSDSEIRYLYRHVPGTSGSYPDPWINFLNDASGQKDIGCDNKDYEDRYPYYDDDENDPNGAFPWHFGESYFFNESQQRIYLRLRDDLSSDPSPSDYSYYVSRYPYGIRLNNADWIWIENLEIRFFAHAEYLSYSAGVLIENGNFNIIRNNRLKFNLNGVKIRWADSDNDGRADDGAAFNLIERNQITTGTPEEWRYCQVKKGVSGNAVGINGSAGNIVRHNEIFLIGENSVEAGAFNSETGCTEYTCPGMTYYGGFEIDIYGNYIHNNVEGIEPDRHVLNVRIYDNYLEHMELYALSQQSGYPGPTWFLRNIYFDNTKYDTMSSEGVLKIRYPKIGSSGLNRYTYLYHNTYVMNRRTPSRDMAMQMYLQYPDIHIKNNIFNAAEGDVARYLCKDDYYAKPSELDYNNYFSPSTGKILYFGRLNSGSCVNFASDTEYYSYEWSELCSNQQVECHGSFGDPGFSQDPAAASNPDFSLADSSINRDAGGRIDGINQIPSYTGIPDVGALEYGTSLICDQNRICEPMVGENGNTCPEDCSSNCIDGDDDGYSVGTGCGTVDCNDENSSIYPGAEEICGDGIDQDCSGQDLECPYSSRRTYQTITIDGLASEWSHISEIALPSDRDLLSGSTTGDNDISAVIKSQWDPSFLYVLVEVRDDTLVQDSDDVYRDDSVELYLDGNNAKTETFDDDDFQITVDFTNRLTGTWSGSISGLQHAARQISDGYIVEYAVPFNILSVTAEIGLVIGFDIGVNDDDDGLDIDSALRLVGTTRDSWRRPSQWGDILMLEGSNIKPPERPASLQAEVLD